MSHIVTDKLGAIADTAELKGWRVVKEPEWDSRYGVGSVMVEQPGLFVWLVVTVDPDDISVVEMQHGEVQYETSPDSLGDAVEDAYSRIAEH